MSDLALQMYEVQAQLIEMKEELGKIKKENDKLRNQMTVNNLMKTISDHVKLSETVRAVQANFNTLSTKVYGSEQILSKINETLIIHAKKFNELNEMKNTLKLQNEVIEVLKRNMKTLNKKTILLLGGWNGNKVVDSLLILQNNGENDGTWKELNIKLPYAVWCHGAQFLDNYLYIFGGQNEKDEILNSSYKLTGSHKWLCNSLQWEKIKDMNERRSGISNSSVVLNDRIWVIGGYNEKERTLKSVEMYNPETSIWTNVKSMNQYRELTAAAVVNGKIFCCGGGSGGGIYLKSAECYDTSSDVWTLISDMPGPNGGCGIVVMDGHSIVIGGKASRYKDFLNSVWVLDTTDKNAKWIEKQPYLSRPLSTFGIAKIDDKVFICGRIYIDKETSNGYTTNNVEIFDGQVWRNSPKLPCDRDSAAAVVIPMEFARSLI